MPICVEPRTFKLLEELEAGEHGTGDPLCSYGLENANDENFTAWTASIVGPPNTTFDNRFYQLRILTGEDYPTAPPTVQFINKVNLPSVSNTGAVNLGALSTLGGWNHDKGIKDILLALKSEMTANRRVNQPGEGETYV